MDEMRVFKAEEVKESEFTMVKDNEDPSRMYLKKGYLKKIFLGKGSNQIIHKLCAALKKTQIITVSQ